MLTRQIHPRELAQLMPDAALQKLDSNVFGIDEPERENRRIRFGRNALPEKKDTPLFLRFLHEFASPFVFLLLGVASLSLYTGETKDAIIISIVLLMNATIGTLQSARASRALKALKRDVTYETRCVVQGAPQVCDVINLVPGDIVELAAGDRVPADGRWISVRDVRVDESSLTGESLPISKTSDAIALKTNAIAADIRNASYAGTTIVSGAGRLLVTAIGGETEVGTIAERLKERRPEPPIVARVRTLSHQVLIVVIIVGLALFLTSIATGREILNSLPLILALIVAIVPEGLPVVLTIVLAKGVSEMSKRNAIVRELQAVESLGGVDTIFTDKTGTLTLNELHFKEAILRDETRIQFTHGVDAQPIVSGDATFAERCALLIAAVADPGARFEPRLRNIDPIDTAFLDLARGYHLDIPRQLDVRPFDGTSRTRAVSADVNGTVLSILAGSPEQVLESCALQNHELYERHILNLAEKGLRVIAFAIQSGTVLDAHADGWEYLGMIGLRDEPRKDVAKSIGWCIHHGIHVTMVTGDHPETAFVIAQDVGLNTTRDNVRLGTDLMQLENEELTRLLPHIRVIARATPEMKMRLIKAARDGGKIIAMTGDGVNDAPALHAADVGVAMGKSGTDVAREAADLVLVDDNFSTIIEAIKEGRSVLGNVQKVVTYLFSTNAMELVVIAVAILLMLPAPLLAAQILWLNLITDALPVIALAMEPTHGGSHKPPRHTLLTKAGWIRIAVLGIAMGAMGLTVYAATLHYSDTFRYSAILLAMTSMQWWAAFSVRSSQSSILTQHPFGNVYLLGAIGAIILLTFFALSGGPLSALLSTGPLPWMWWIVIVFTGSIIILPDELFKYISRLKKTPV